MVRIRRAYRLAAFACAALVVPRLPAQAPAVPAAAARVEAVAPTVRVAAVLGRDGDATALKARMLAAQALGNDLQPAELAALYAFMDRKAGEDSLPVAKLTVVKNDVANAMLRQTRPPPELGQHLVAMSARQRRRGAAPVPAGGRR